jgi:hypothetical protein
MAARLIKFMGSHPDLVTGHMYTAREYASVSGVPHNAMATRLHRTLEAHDSHLRPLHTDTKFGSKSRGTITPKQRSSFSTHTEKFSGEWLKRRLT